MKRFPLPSISSKVYCLLSPTTHRPLLMKVIQNNLAASSLSSIVHYTMNTLPPKIMLAQQANLHRGTPQAWINTHDFHETKAKTLPRQEPLCQGHALMTFPCMAKSQKHWITYFIEQWQCRVFCVIPFRILGEMCMCYIFEYWMLLAYLLIILNHNMKNWDWLFLSLLRDF